MVVAQHSLHVDMGKHVFQHGDGVGGDPEEPDLAWDSSCWSARMPSSSACSMSRVMSYPMSCSLAAGGVTTVTVQLDAPLGHTDGAYH